MNVTTIPVGSTGQVLEGVAVSTGVRESVILTSPSDADGFAEIVSSQPIQAYGLPVWLQGTPSVAIAGSVVVDPTSTQIVSSIPFYVSQSSAPWTMNGGVSVTNVPTVNVTNVPLVTVQGTSSVNVISSAPHALVGTSQIFGTVSTQVVSSIPFFVSQSSGPWTISPTGTTMVNIVSTVTQGANITSSIPFFVAQSSAPWTINGQVGVSSQPAVSSSWPLSTTMSNVVSSIPFFVAQSSAPWVFVETVSTAGGLSATTIALAANLNTTVVKASAGQVYGMLGSNVGSSNVFVRFLNASTAATAIASTGVALLNVGIPISTSPYNNYDAGVPFSAGITILTQQQPYTASTSLAPTASTATITILFK